MRIFTTLTFLILSINLLGQVRTIQGQVIDENLEGIPMAKIFTKDTVQLAEANIDGQFKIEIPIDTKELLFGWIGMEFTTVKFKNDCDTFDIILMNDVLYDFISSRKVDRLRFRRFKKLPELHLVAFEKGLFTTKTPCYSRDFEAHKPQLDEIKKNRKLK